MLFKDCLDFSMTHYFSVDKSQKTAASFMVESGWSWTDMIGIHLVMICNCILQVGILRKY
jgi:hypothetical protein